MFTLSRQSCCRYRSSYPSYRACCRSQSRRRWCHSSCRHQRLPGLHQSLCHPSMSPRFRPARYPTYPMCFPVPTHRPTYHRAMVPRCHSLELTAPRREFVKTRRVASVWLVLQDLVSYCWVSCSLLRRCRCLVRRLHRHRGCRPRRSGSASSAGSASVKHAGSDSLPFLSTQDDVIALRLDWSVLHKFQHRRARSASQQKSMSRTAGRAS